MNDIQPLQTALNLEALAKLKGLPTGAVQELTQAAEIIRFMYELSIELCVDALQAQYRATQTGDDHDAKREAKRF
jgi:hypothetical protein